MDQAAHAASHPVGQRCFSAPSRSRDEGFPLVPDHKMPVPPMVTYVRKLPSKMKPLKYHFDQGTLVRPSDVYNRNPMLDKKLMNSLYIDEDWVEDMNKNHYTAATVDTDDDSNDDDEPTTFGNRTEDVPRKEVRLQKVFEGTFVYGGRYVVDGFEFTSIHVSGENLLKKVRRIAGVLPAGTVENYKNLKGDEKLRYGRDEEGNSVFGLFDRSTGELNLGV
eukprot:GHVQ01000261.1.p1 GENE.GHVQ01000261.1~~GHVQ01000261.1.p1  ORF type:complete len:220 (+),score=37.11 GHVQ01000261.1:560-1219(+)